MPVMCIFPFHLHTLKKKNYCLYGHGRLCLIHYHVYYYYHSSAFNAWNASPSCTISNCVASHLPPHSADDPISVPRTNLLWTCGTLINLKVALAKNQSNHLKTVCIPIRLISCLKPPAIVKRSDLIWSVNLSFHWFLYPWRVLSFQLDLPRIPPTEGW